MPGPLDREALVAALRALPGVLDADVDPDDRGGLGTLRLDLEPGVDEGDVAGRVSRVLREEFGLGVDSERAELRDADISVVEDVRPEPAPSGPVPVTPASISLPPLPSAAASPSPPADLPPADLPIAEPQAPASASVTASVEDVREVRSVTLPLPRASRRASIAKMHLVSAGLDMTATVTLASAERVAVGESRGLASSTGVHRAVASATLRAVEQLVGDGVRLELEHLEVTPMGSERTVVVLLTLLTERGGESLTGAATVRDDVRQAVIRATLDALNRRLELLLTEV